jgi:hypothetical protein
LDAHGGAVLHQNALDSRAIAEGGHHDFVSIHAPRAGGDVAPRTAGCRWHTQRRPGWRPISGNVVTLTGVGSVTIEATQDGNGTYAPATPVDQSFTVAPAQRGCIAYDQIKASDRTGNGNQLLTYTPAPASMRRATGISGTG